jgi:hypothetical protein
LLTLTDLIVKDLSREAVDRLTGCFSRLRRSKVWNSVTTVDGKQVGVTGGVYTVECTYRPVRDGWHIHIHALIEMPGRNPDGWLDELKAEWFRVTGTARNLHLQPLYRRSRRGKKIYRGVNRKAIKELVKYVTKAVDFAASPERVASFLHAFKHVRRYQCFGSFQGALKKEGREPGEDGKELKCSCGNYHYHSQFAWSRRPVHISETIVGPNGERQLKWDFWAEMAGSVEESPPNFELVRQEVERYKQFRIGFSGALPSVSEELPSLFAA